MSRRYQRIYDDLRDLDKKSKKIKKQKRQSQIQRIRKERQKMYDIVRSRIALAREAERLEKLFEAELNEEQENVESKEEKAYRHKLPSKKKLNELEMMLRQMKKCNIENKDIHPGMSFTELCLNNYQVKK